VHDNIGAFGGDPDRVTVFGQSAVADSVFSLVLCEQTTGLFQRAIMQSAPLGVHHGIDGLDSQTLRFGYLIPANVGYPHALRRKSVTYVHTRAGRGTRLRV
jgi:carboxylesterase type B